VKEGGLGAMVVAAALLLGGAWWWLGQNSLSGAGKTMAADAFVTKFGLMVFTGAPICQLLLLD
jgi:hypothetical protein